MNSISSKEQVILVDRTGQEIGTADKLDAHRDGALHRAFSIFVFDGNGKVLLQQRARRKYHSKGLWSNTCCSHPRPHESLHDAVHRRLREEMGFDCALKEIFTFTYKVQLADDVVEHEYDHVFFGHYDGILAPNPAEVNSWKWTDLTELRKDIHENPDRYTYWLRLCIDQVISERQAIRETVESQKIAYS